MRTPSVGLPGLAARPRIACTSALAAVAVAGSLLVPVQARAADIGVLPGRYENTSSAITFAGAWTTVTSSSDSGGSYSNLAASGSAQLSFSGTGLTWSTRVNDFSGLADVYLDGVKETTVDLYSATRKAKQPVYSATGLTDGTHTVKIVRTGIKNDASTGRNVTVDYLDVVDSTAPPAPTSLTATSSGPMVTLGWTAGPAADVAGYHVYRATGSDGYSKVSTVLVTSAGYVDDGLAPGTTYSYQVSAVDRAGNESALSAAATATPTTATPTAATTTTPTPTPTPTGASTPAPTPTPTLAATLAPAPTVSSTPAACPTPTAAPRLHLPAQPRVLLVGDSYTEGLGAVPMTNGYAYKIAGPLGWTLTRDGKGGSGYVNPTSYGAGTFGDRLPNHPADSYDLVVIQGSSNDVKYGSPQLDTNLNLTLGIVRDRYPRAQVLMLGPTSPYGNPSPDLVRVNGEVKAAAASCGVPFIDPIAERWFVPGDGTWAVNPANGHPSNAGYQVIADRFIADERALS